MFQQIFGSSCADRAGAPAIDRLAAWEQSPPGFFALRPEEKPMFAFSDLFQWERFITPQIIKIFYWLAVAVAVLAGLSGVGSGLAMMFINPFAGLIAVLISVIIVIIGVIFARIAAEFILIVFRISEHLGAIRARGGEM